MSKGSILDSIIFDIFFCDMFFMIDTMNIASYAGDNTLYDGEKTDKTEKQIWKKHPSNFLNGYMKMAWKLIKINAIFCRVLTQVKFSLPACILEN